MRKQFVHLIVLTGLLVLVAGAACAQDNEMNPAVRLNIPFDFYAGSLHLPAGAYTFDVDPVAHAVTIEQDVTGHVFFLSGMPAEPVTAGNPVLTFKDQGGDYRLEELRAEVGGVEFPPAHGTESYEAHK
jgi:hypothetical protein